MEYERSLSGCFIQIVLFSCSIFTPAPLHGSISESWCPPTLAAGSFMFLAETAHLLVGYKLRKIGKMDGPKKIPATAYRASLIASKYKARFLEWRQKRQAGGKPQEG